MITKEALEAAGYQEYPEKLKPGVKHAFQKTFWEPGSDFEGQRVKSFFINVYIWDWSEFRNRMSQEAMNNVGLSAEAVFYRKQTPEVLSFDVNLHVRPHHTIDQVEGFFKGAYVSMGCIPDIHNN